MQRMARGVKLKASNATPLRVEQVIGGPCRPNCRHSFREAIMYTYKANIRSIYDGDSCRVDLDLGMSVWLHNQSIRLYGIDTAEIRGGTVETKALET